MGDAEKYLNSLFPAIVFHGLYRVHQSLRPSPFRSTQDFNRAAVITFPSSGSFPAFPWEDIMASNHPANSTFRYREEPIYTTSNGAPVDNPEGWQRIGSVGPLLLQDFHLIDNLAHFDRT
jgi:hypothetical protein